MKKSINKLNLNKMTITNLDSSEMNAQVGGVVKTKTVTTTITSTPVSYKCTTVKI